MHMSGFTSFFRKSPLHKLYSFLQPQETEIRSSMGTAAVELPSGFHHLYTSIEYECISPLYQTSGSARRTCLKTGKWSGRHVTCLPGGGSTHTFRHREALYCTVINIPDEPSQQYSNMNLTVLHIPPNLKAIK